MKLDQAQSRGPWATRSSLGPASLCAISMLCTLPGADVHSAAADQAPAPITGSAAPARTRVKYNQKEELYFERRYGIDQLHVHSVSLGASLEFRCRVLDAEKAKALKGNRAASAMVDRRTGTKLSVPATETSAKPFQSGALEAGQEYWVVFGNRNKLVKPGDMVDVVVGTVHMSGLIVE
jgi:hypothetical protein